ncbi:aryl-alcohol dehydrogenase-like predicted oxidoreductase [Streptomyces sp. Ag109_O5-1]|uniref:oxidoreductase n=1 Tax=Streptomyces sp. Ag109_O5-1 TaxID=1938851 RepID=UPI000F4ECE33|nr:oxidoreductase [Streptomyces sp. Ag109_O5-1]RPE37489.1 aryl-alcohol dehydrogenase-like predicted oxidoreductase [Streptomyces sp. Ag109_O5-1]
MTAQLAGTLTPADGLTLTRVGYGAMQLAGPHVFGPPKDRARAVAVLRAAVEAGITHIDTADFYGPVVVNEIIREALRPYPEDLRIVTKVGARRTADGDWIMMRHPEDLKAQVYDNLRNLGVEALDVVNLRLGDMDTPNEDPIADQFGALAELREAGLIRHLGLSTASTRQLAEAQGIAPVVTVQNMYNLANRRDDALVERTAAQNIAFVPYFPLGGFSPLQSETLTKVAERLGAAAQQVALAWLLQRSPNIALIPGTSSPEHLRENIAAAALVLPEDAVCELDGIGQQTAG